LWKELPQIDILDEGTDPYQEFQGPDAEEVPRFSPCARIVPCIGIDCPKLGLPPVEKVADEKVLLPNVLIKENSVEPTGILCEGGP
jgi:hypothetical protein